VSMRLVLASASPRRRELLAAVGYKYDVITSHVDEDEVAAGCDPGNPAEIVTALAEAKARAVARTIDDNALVIGADTIVWHEGAALNKPVDAEDAQRMLLSLAGKTHQVYTGIAVVPTGACVLRPSIVEYEATEVEFGPFGPARARAYVATGEPMDKAGAYGIQEYGAALVRQVRGDYFTVVGLPLYRICRILTDFGLPPWDGIA